MISPIIIRVAMGDVDAERIHFASLFRYADRAQAEFYAQLGYPVSIRLGSSLIYPIVSATCQYFSVIKLDDELEVDLRIEVGTTSYVGLFTFTGCSSRERCAEVRLTHVCVDRASQRPVTAPQWVHDFVAATAT